MSGDLKNLSATNGEGEKTNKLKDRFMMFLEKNYKSRSFYSHKEDYFLKLHNCDDRKNILSYIIEKRICREEEFTKSVEHTSIVGVYRDDKNFQEYHWGNSYEERVYSKTGYYKGAIYNGCNQIISVLVLDTESVVPKIVPKIDSVPKPKVLVKITSETRERYEIEFDLKREEAAILYH